MTQKLIANCIDAIEENRKLNVLTSEKIKEKFSDIDSIENIALMNTAKMVDDLKVKLKDAAITIYCVNNQVIDTTEVDIMGIRDEKELDKVIDNSSFFQTMIKQIDYLLWFEKEVIDVSINILETIIDH